MAFGDVVRQATCSFDPRGIGGNADVIWYTDGDGGGFTVKELYTSDLSVKRSAGSPAGSYAYGIGGDADTIWWCGTNTDLIHELATSDLQTLRNAASPDTSPYGVGGDADTIWHCDGTTKRAYELSTTDFSVVRTSPQVFGNPSGVGGNASVIWLGDMGAFKTYDLSVSDFSVLREAAQPATMGYGTGGGSATIWHCDGAAAPNQRVFELDAAASPPTTTTQAVSDIAVNTATGNGNLTSLGDGSVTAHGHCWNTTGNPTTADDKVDNGVKGETGAFTSAMTDLIAGTLYYVRAYATSEFGTGYGEQVEFTTVDTQALGKTKGFDFRGKGFRI